jgi:hypothetical protein
MANIKLNRFTIYDSKLVNWRWQVFKYSVNSKLPYRGRRGREHMLVGFTYMYAISAYHHWCCEFESRSGRGVQYFVIVCQWLATGRWFSPGPSVSSTNKTDRHDITEILLKMVKNTIKQTNPNCDVYSPRPCSISTSPFPSPITHLDTTNFPENKIWNQSQIQTSFFFCCLLYEF